MNRLYPILFVLISFIACQPKSNHFEPEIIGQWKPIALVSADSLVDLNFEVMSLTLDSNNSYVFVNNLNMLEAGKYLVKDSILVLSDTTKSPMKQKGLSILKVTKDSLVILMNIGGQENILYSKRQP